MKLSHKKGVINVVVDCPAELLTEGFQRPYYELVDELQGLGTSVDDMMADIRTRQHWPAVAKSLAESGRLSAIATHRVTREDLEIRIEVAHA